MTPEEGYRLAKHQRPGVRIVMGPTEARDEWMKPLSFQEWRKLPGPDSWRLFSPTEGWITHEQWQQRMAERIRAKNLPQFVRAQPKDKT